MSEPGKTVPLTDEVMRRVVEAVRVRPNRLKSLAGGDAETPADALGKDGRTEEEIAAENDRTRRRLRMATHGPGIPPGPEETAETQ